MDPNALAKVKGKKQRITPDEVKAQLFTKLKEEGIFNEFRAFLRNELVKHLYMIEPEHVRRKSNKDSDLVPKFPLEATNWLIAEHLRRNRYDFTLSVFDLESSSSKSRRAFNFLDILSFLGIDLNSESARAALEPFQNQRDKHFLWKLLSLVTAPMKNEKGFPLKLDSTEQTEAFHDKAEKLEDRLWRIDNIYESKKQHLDGPFVESVNPRVARLKKLNQFDDEFERVLQHSRLDLGHFYEREKQKYRKEMDDWRKSLEEQYQNKLQLLADRERESTTSLERQKSWFEEEMYRQRQEMLLELSKFRQREEEWESKRHFQEKMMGLESERVTALKKDMQNREESLRKLETDHERWTSEQKDRIAMAEQRKLQERLRDLDAQELELSGRHSNLEIKEKLLQEKEQNFRKAVEESERLRMELAEMKERVKYLQTEKESLTKHAGAGAENVKLKEEVRHLRTMNQQRMEHEEMERARNAVTIRELSERLARPPVEVTRLQRELEHLKLLYRKDLDRWTDQQGRLEDALRRAENQHRIYIERLKIQSHQIITLHKTIEDLQNGLLWKHPRKSTDPNPNWTADFFNAKKIPDQQLKATDSLYDTAIDLHGTYFDTSLNPSHLPPELELGASTSLIDSFGLQYNDPDFLESTTMFDSTQARIVALEEEAKMLEQNYQALRMKSGENILKTGPKNLVGFFSKHTKGNNDAATNIDNNEWTARKDLDLATNYTTRLNNSTPSGSPKASATYETSPVLWHSRLGQFTDNVSKWSQNPDGFQRSKSLEQNRPVQRSRSSMNEDQTAPQKLSGVTELHLDQQIAQQQSAASFPLGKAKHVSGKTVAVSLVDNLESPPIEAARPFHTTGMVSEKEIDDSVVINDASEDVLQYNTGPVIASAIKPVTLATKKPLDEEKGEEVHSPVVMNLDSAWKNALQISTPLDLDDVWKASETQSNLDQLWKSQKLDLEDSADIHQNNDAGVPLTTEVRNSQPVQKNANHISNSESAAPLVTQLSKEPDLDEYSSDEKRISGERASPLGSHDDDFEW